MIHLRDGSTTDDPRLDRLIQFDERSRGYPLVRGTTLEDREPRSYSWDPRIRLNQGNEGACVGFGLGYELASRPIAVPSIDARFCREQVYWPAQRDDPWPGGAYPGASPFMEGTSVLAGLKVVRDLGYCREFRWVFSLRELRIGIGYWGPAVAGLWWYTGMFEPDSDGRIRPTGVKEGGHCIELFRNWEPTSRRPSGQIWIPQSWGVEHGDGGLVWMTHDDFEKVQMEDGEAAFLVDRMLP